SRGEARSSPGSSTSGDSCSWWSGASGQATGFESRQTLRGPQAPRASRRAQRNREHFLKSAADLSTKTKMWINYFGVRVTDLARSIDFYTKVFNLVEIARGGN